jgi:gliding motility-associated-like protein
MVTRAQNLPTTCVNGKVRYGVGAKPLPGSTIIWDISGGSIIKNYNDSIDVQWGSNPGQQTLSYIEKTKYGCYSSQEINYVQLNKPYIDLGTKKTICQGESTTLDASGAFVKYLWNDGSSLSSFIASKPGIYWVEVTDNAGCIFRDTIAIAVNSLPIVTLEKNIAVCAPATHRFDVSTTANATNYLWFNGGTSSYYDAVEGDSLIWVKVSDDYGCAGYDTTTLITCNLSNKIPNAFTPNGDNDNDVWRLDLIKAQYPNLVVKIYDRWGRVVFVSARGYGSPWDGSSNGKPLPMDTYYYVIDFGNGAKELVGSIALIR